MSIKPFSELVAEARAHIREIAPEELHRRREAGEPVTVIDVREDAEWARGHLPGAIHLGRGVLDCYIAQRVPDPAAQIVLYCGSGARSALAVRTLEAMGYRNVASMASGIQAWANAGLPLAQD